MKVKGMFLSWIVVADINAAVKFYTEVVGLELKELNTEYGWAELSGPEGFRLGIAQACPEHEEIKPGTNAVVTVSVDNLDEAMEHLVKKGARLVGEVWEVPGEVRMQTFLDTDGNTLQACEMLK